MSEITGIEFTLTRVDDGAEGERGGLFLKVTTAPSSYSTTIDGFTPSYRILKSTVLTQSGADDVKVGDVLQYSYYNYPVGYVDTTYVYTTARSSIRGASGGKWYAGTGITGTSTTATKFPQSGVSSAVVGDMYLNTDTYNTYRCTTAGNANNAKWVYECNIEGANGIGVTGVTPQYYLSTSSTALAGGSWSDSPQTFVDGRFYWTRQKITYTDTSIDYSAEVYNAGMTQASQDALDAVTIAEDTVQYFWTDADGVHVTQVPQDDYIQDPTSAGINILINSTNGMQVLDGLTVLAMYSVTEIIGEPDGAHVEVTPSGVSIVSSDGVLALDVSVSGGTATVNVTKSISRTIEEFPDTFTVPDLANAIAGSTFKLKCFESGAPFPFSKTFTQGTASSESTSAHTIAYNGTTGFTVTGSGRIRILSVTYSATVAIPAVDMQGEISVNGTVVSDNDWHIETRKSLWTNSSPTSSFSAQTILSGDADLAECDAVEVYYRAQDSDSRVLYQKIRMSNVGYLQVGGWNANRTGGRTVTVSTSNIYFSGATYNAGASNNAFAVPVEVIGIKNA